MVIKIITIKADNFGYSLSDELEAKLDLIRINLR